MDTDKRGVELRDELVRRLGMDRCKVVAWGEGCKDANEYLLKYDLPRLRQQVEQAAEIPLEGVFCPMDEWDTLMDIYYNGMPEGTGESGPADQVRAWFCAHGHRRSR